MNQFLATPQPMDAQPRPEQDQSPFEFAAMQHAQDEGVRQGILQLLRAQVQSNLQGGAQLGATGLGKGVVRPAINYLTGEAGTTLSSTSASALEQVAARQAATQTAADIEAGGQTAAGAGVAQGGGTSLLGAVGTGLGVAGTLYGSYQGIQSGLHSANSINSAIRSSPNMDPAEADRLRQKNFNAQMVNSGIGGVGGAIGGSGLGPAGIIIGSLLGGAGGALGASRTYKDSDHPAQDTAKALGRFVSNPFKR